mgnify:CR=1 FL=1
MTKISGVLFDLYGTLFDVHSVVERCDQLFPGRGIEISALWRQKQLEYMWARGLMRRYCPFEKLTEDALGYTCNRLDLALNERDSADLCDAYSGLDPFPDTAATLEMLRSIGAPVGVLSNGSAQSIRRVVHHSALQTYFSHLISTEPVRAYKPQAAAYELGEQALGASRETILFVSSNGLDAAGAKNFGYTVAWINRSGSPFEELEVRPDVEVRSLAALSGWLREGDPSKRR